MRNLKSLTLLAALATTVAAHAALAPIAPFASPKIEKFDALAPGAYAGFPGMFGFCGFGRIPAANALVVGGGAVLPPFAGPNAMFGRGANVVIRLQADRRAFGGYFRVPNAGIAVTHAKFIFKNAGGGVVGMAIAPINNAFWLWRGWLSNVPFRIIEIHGVGGALPGYVGMDDVRVNP